MCHSSSKHRTMYFPVKAPNLYASTSSSRMGWGGCTGWVKGADIGGADVAFSEDTEPGEAVVLYCTTHGFAHSSRRNGLRSKSFFSFPFEENLAQAGVGDALCRVSVPKPCSCAPALGFTMSHSICTCSISAQEGITYPFICLWCLTAFSENRLSQHDETLPPWSQNSQAAVPTKDTLQERLILTALS